MLLNVLPAYNWTPSMLVLNTEITNKLVLKNTETIVHNAAESVRHTADQSQMGLLKIFFLRLKLRKFRLRNNSSRK